MAIVQISQITQRKGYYSDLPQLAGAEFGWCLDQRRLFIGNGTLEEGAPVIGNTEILTEFSDIFSFQTNYTYKDSQVGYTPQTGATIGTPVTQSLQQVLDQWCTIKDFGAVGDGVTDDTDAINRAMEQIYCIQSNPQIRRGIFFPAGVYLVSDTINIPPYAYLYGEGADSSVISLNTSQDSTLRPYVARTCDSKFQTGVNIGVTGGTAPTYINIVNMGFDTQGGDVDVFLLEQASNVTFQNVNFTGPLTTANIISNLATDNIAGVRFASSPINSVNSVNIDRCFFSGLTYGVADDVDQVVEKLIIANGKFDTLYQGVVMSEPTSYGIVVAQNKFDNIYSTAVDFSSQSSGTSFNTFLDVGNELQGAGNPVDPNITWSGTGVSIGDTFARDAADQATSPCISSGTNVIAMTNGDQLKSGTYTRQSGLVATLVNNDSGTAVTLTQKAFTINYTINRSADGFIRTGVISGTNFYPTGTLAWSDDYNENSDTGFALNLVNASGNTEIQYSDSLDTGNDAAFYYSITYLD